MLFNLIIRKKPYPFLNKGDLFVSPLQVLHGCCQFVFWNLWFSPLTNETLAKRRGQPLSYRIFPDIGKEVENHFKSSWPLWMGLEAFYNGIDNQKQWGDSKQILKRSLTRNWCLQFDTMNLELTVIVDHHATVNLYLHFELTARHTLEIRGILNKSKNSVSLKRSFEFQNL